MNTKELKEYFLKQLIDGNIYILLKKGNAKYRMSRGSFKTSDSTYSKHKLTFKEVNDNVYTFSDKDVSLNVSLKEEKDRFTLSFEKNDVYNRFSLRFKSFMDEYIYGCGEQYTHLNLKGEKVDVWVSEHQQVLKIAKKFLREKLFGVNPAHKAKYSEHQTYFSSPNFTSSKNYFVETKETGYGKIEFKKEETILNFRQIPESITFIFADSQLELSKKVCNYVGIQPRLPEYVGGGAIVAIQGGTDRILEKYEYLKENGVKISGVWSQDWSGQIVTEFGSQVYWNWELDSTLYHDFKKLIERLNKDNVKFLGYINTFLKEDSPLYNYAKENDYLAKKKDGSIYHIKSTTFDAGIVDLTYDKAYSWYKELIKKNMIGVGLSGWMADFGEYLPTDSVVHGGNAEELHNLWPTLWAKCNYEAIKETDSIGKVLVFNRAAYSDTSKYTTSMWNGDQHVDFSDEFGLGSVVPATLSMALTGTGINHSDIGGYTTVLHMKRNKELMLRWGAFNIFTPVYRCHEGNRPNANVQSYSEDIVKDFAYFSRIFSALKEYRDDVLDEYYTKGIPFNRPLFFHFDEEECYTIQDEFMCGEELIVHPVSRPNIERVNVFLPKGNWIDLVTGVEYKGGINAIDAPLGKPMAFYKKGSKHEELFKKVKEIEK